MPQMLRCAAGSNPGAFRLFLPKTIDNQKKHRYTKIIKQKRKGLGAMKVSISYPHFSTWNIDNGATSFRNQTSEDYDPKLHELLGLLKHSGG